MRWLIALILCFLLSGSIVAQQFGYKQNFVLVWHDEFADSNTTYQLWDKIFPWGPWAGGLQHFGQPGNHAFPDTVVNLIINNNKVENGIVYAWDSAGNFTPYYRDFDYTGGMLYSKTGFTNGYFEGKFRSDKGKSFHNAFWLYGEESSEIDIFEIMGSEPDDAQMTLHWKDKDPLTGSSQSITHIKANPDFDAQYHTFGLLWTADDLVWYLNNKAVQDGSFTKYIRKRHIPKVPLHIILSAGISGIDGEPDASTPFPAVMQFDYVRAYQPDSLAPAPQITAQQALMYNNYEAFSLELDSFLVTDFYKTYPYGHKIVIEPGNNYQVVSENELKVAPDHKTPITVAVKVCNGIKCSGIFNATIQPSEGVINNIAASKTIKSSINWQGSSLVFTLPTGCSEATALLVNVEGKIVYSALINNTHTLKTNTFAPGLYNAIIQTQGKFICTKKIAIP